ncbi:MAG: MFS transporter [Nitrososphaerota archaeon]|nr:MFS transporter [Nitrososphaerota archaeon]
MANQKASLLAVLLPILLYSIFRFSVGPILPSMQAAYAISYASAGYIVSLSIGMVGIGTGISGIIARRFGDRNTVLFGLLLFAFPVIVLTILSSNYLIFATLFIFSGLGCGLMTTPTYSIAATIFPHRKGAAIGFVSAAYNIGAFIGPVLTGSLSGYFSWTVPLATIGLLGFVFSIILFSALRSLKPTAQRTDRRIGLRKFLGNRSFVIVMISMILGDFAFLSFITWTPEFLLRALSNQMSLTSIDAYFGVAVGLGGVGVTMAGLLLDRIGGKRSTLLGSAFATFSVVGLFLSDSLVTVLAFMFFAGFFSNWFWGLLSTMAQSYVSSERKTDAVALAQTAAFVGAFTGPAAAGLLTASFNIGSALLLVVSLPYAALTILMLFLHDDRPIRALDHASFSRS